MKRITKVYLHSSKEDMLDKFEELLELPYEHEVIQRLKYCLYEVELTLEVDDKTGDYKILKVDGYDLCSYPTKLIESSD